MLVADEAAGRILRDAGYPITMVWDGNDVLDKLASEKPDAVILPMTADGELPRGKLVKRRARPCGVIMMTPGFFPGSMAKAVFSPNEQRSAWS